nr:MAG TPA: transposase [Caudoviricetes sp.]
MAFKNTVDKNEFIKNYNELKSASKMAELYNVSKDVIQLYAKHIGYVNHYRFEATTEQIQYIINNYYLKSSKDIADEIGCSKGFVKKYGVSMDLMEKQIEVIVLTTIHLS